MASSAKSVIVTGAASGIGLAMSVALLTEGHDVTAVEFRVVNPHSQLIFTMADDEGNEAERITARIQANSPRCRDM